MTRRNRLRKAGRIAVYAPVRRSRGIPLVGRLALGAGVLAVGIGVLYVGAGGIGVVANALGTTITTFVSGVTATPVPSQASLTVPDAPSIQSPAEPYTNQGQVDLNKTGQNAIVGDLVIGNNAGGTGADIVRWLNNNQVGNTSTVTVTGSVKGGREFSFTLGGGAARLSLESFDGTIRLVRTGR